MKPKRILTIAIVFSTILCSCKFEEFQEMAGQQFTDQYFKTAISLIELHKIRTGEYPIVLDSIKYIGDFDEAALESVEYRRLDSGYELNISSVWPSQDSIDISYPDEFWSGLGLVKSNLKE